MSKGFFIVSIALGFGISLVLNPVATVLSYLSPYPEMAIYYSVPAVILTLYGFIVFLVLIYKMWEAIQDGHALTTPGKAVGFLFIPLFNIGWFFVALWGFAVDYNKYLTRHSLAQDSLPQKLFLAYPILFLSSNLTLHFDILERVGLNAILSLAGLIVLLVMASRICDGVNSLPAITASDLRHAAENVCSFCTSCGKNIEAGDKFCPHCGNHQQITDMS